MAATSYSLGIDLGTTFTAAAVHRNGRTDIAPLGNRAAAIPTLVFLRDDETILTGEAAERRGLTEPTRLAREFKRRVGDSVPIMLGQAPYSAERLMAALLRQVVAAVATREGSPPDRVAVSHPANWGPFKIDLLRHALDLAGLRSVTLVSEPVAAAMHYASTERVEPGAIVAVYDLGGGTFDAAVLKKTEHGFETLGEPEGIERLGGIDFDEAVMAHVRNALHGKLEELDTQDPGARAALARLRQECVAAKEALSFDSDTSISVLLPNVQTDIRVTRGEFEPMIRAAINETIDALRRAIERTGVTPDDLSAVLLVGGSSQIPLVSELVSNALGRPVAVDAHPKHSIALGAAIAAAGDSEPVPARALAAVPAAPGTMSANGDGRSSSPIALAPSEAATAPARTLQPVAVAAATSAPPRPAGNGPVAPPRPPAGAPAPPSGPTAPRRSSRSWIAALVALVAVIGAAVVGATVVGGGGGGEPNRQAETPATETTIATDTDDAPPPAFDCRSDSGRCAFITNLRVEDGTYVADYDVKDFDPIIFEPGVRGTPEDHHVHFFFNSTAPENAGTNGHPPGAWTIWDRAAGGGELRFDGLDVEDAGTANQLCIRVADFEHGVEADSGNCVDLP
jgi:actin-like ATPase involved in cell morphogenesis